MKIKIGDITRIRTGKLDANASTEDGIYPFFTCSKRPLKIDKYSYDCECVLVAGNGDLNVKYYNGKFDAYQRTYIIEDNSNGKLFMPYLYYFLEGYVNVLRLQAIGGVIKYIKLSNLTDARIELYDIKKQKAIVECLKKVNRILKNKTKQIDLLDELIKSRFVELFGDILCNSKGWPIYTLDAISSSRLGKMLDAKRNTGKNSFPYLANFNVQWFEFDLSELHEMDFNDVDREEFSLKDGDLLITEGGEVGRCAIWHKEISDCYFQKALHRVRCDKNIILPEYLAWWFKFHSDFNGFEDIVGGKATIAHLPGVKLKKLKIEVPDINVQKDFVSFWQEIDKLKVVIQNSLSQTKLLFDSLMQEYFG